MTQEQSLQNLASGQASDLTGAYSPEKLRRAALLKDAQKLYSGEAKMTQAEKRQITDATARQVGAGLEAQSQELGQMALAAGPRDMGRFQKLQRETAKEGIASATAQAGAEAERLGMAREMAEKQSLEAALERQQQLDWQREQYYTQLLTGVVTSAMENAAGVVKGAAGMGA